MMMTPSVPTEAQARCEHEFSLVGMSHAYGLSPHMIGVLRPKAQSVEELLFISEGATTMVMGCRKCGLMTRAFVAGKPKGGM